MIAECALMLAIIGFAAAGLPRRLQQQEPEQEAFAAGERCTPFQARFFQALWGSSQRATCAHACKSGPDSTACMRLGNGGTGVGRYSPPLPQSSVHAAQAPAGRPVALALL